VESAVGESESRERGRWPDYVALARPDHWIKHIFILPGIALAVLLQPLAITTAGFSILFGFVAAMAAASANYVINEWLDAPFDAHHHEKSQRPAVAKRLSPSLVYAEYGGLVLGALGLGWTASPTVAILIGAFLVSGLIYNVPPLRTKERAYLDVLTEAINNPIRLTLGWAMVDPTSLPPSSLVFTFWMGGAFLMAVKRMAEYRGAEVSGRLPSLSLYRSSFRAYTANGLLLTSFFYAQLAAFFLAVFTVKYRIEYLLALPLVGLLFAVYLRLGLMPDSSAQAPEKLFRERSLVAIVWALVLALVVLSWVEIPALHKLSEPYYPKLFR